MKEQRKNKPLVAGLTGSLGSGKTTVARIFKRKGVYIIDADEIYHSLIRTNSIIYRKIVGAFSNRILDRKLRIDRAKLARVVFDKKKDLKKLCRITHPYIIEQIKKELLKAKKIKENLLILVDAPLLIEAGLLPLVDVLIVVKSTQENQINRCRLRFGLSRDAVLKRIKSQIPLKKKIALADYVVDNNGTLTRTKQQVENIIKLIVKQKT